MEKHNIAFFIYHLDPANGGTERVTYKVSSELSKIGYNPYYIFCEHDSDLIPQGKKLKIIPNDRSNSLLEEISKFLNDNGIGVLIIVNQSLQTHKWQKIYEEIKKRNEIKYIACLHASPDNWKKEDKLSLTLPKIYLKSRLKRYLCYFYNRNKEKSVGMYNIADKFLLLSDKYIFPFQKTFHIDDSKKHKLFAIPNPCPFKDGYDGTKRENVVLICSRMAEIQKRIYMALKIWKVIYKHTDGWILRIVGDGPQLEDYKSYCNQHSLKNVEFVGHSNNVQQYYKSSKIFMMTSIWEGQPMSLIEAMHYGCVPIAIDSFESIHDLIIDGQNGVLCRFNDLRDFSEKLRFLLQHPNVVEKYSSYILNNPIKYFELESILNKWDAVLRSLLKMPSRVLVTSKNESSICKFLTIKDKLTDRGG